MLPPLPAYRIHPPRTPPNSNKLTTRPPTPADYVDPPARQLPVRLNRRGGAYSAPPPPRAARPYYSSDEEDRWGPIHDVAYGQMANITADAFHQLSYDKCVAYHLFKHQTGLHPKARPPPIPLIKDNLQRKDYQANPTPPTMTTHFPFYVGTSWDAVCLKVYFPNHTNPFPLDPSLYPQLSNEWIIDSGATASCTPHRRYFIDSAFVDKSFTLAVGDGGKLPVLGYGPIDLGVTTHSGDTSATPTAHHEPLSLPFALHCPALQFNLLSVRHCVQAGCHFDFSHPSHCLMDIGRGLYLRAQVNALGLYSFPAQPYTRLASNPPPHPPATVAAAIMDFQANLAAHPSLGDTSPFYINFATPTPSSISTLESTVQAAARSEVIDQLHIYIVYFGRSPKHTIFKSPSSKAVHFSLPPTTTLSPPTPTPRPNASSLISCLSGTSKFPSAHAFSPTSNVITPIQSTPISPTTNKPLLSSPPPTTPTPTTPSLALTTATTSTTRLSNAALFRLWHNRLGHPSSTVLQSLVKTHPDFSTDRPRLFKSFTCDTCEFAKSRRQQFSSAAVFRASSFLLLVHTDIWGPCPVPSIGGSFYFVVFIDDYSRFTWVYPLAFRKDLYDAYELFRLQAITTFKTDINTLQYLPPTDIGNLQADNAKEFEKLGRIIGPKYSTKTTFSNAYSPAQNAVAERRIGLLVMKMRALLLAGNLPKFLWAEAVIYSAWLYNISPSSSNDGQSPYHRVFSRHPPLAYIHTFGCTAFVHIQKANQTNKLDARAIKCMFVGLPDDRKGYKLLNAYSHQLLYSRDVVFHEDEFPPINTIQAAAAFRLRARDASDIPSITPHEPLPPLSTRLDPTIFPPLPS
ncbi:hypothetical protein AaE_012624, partial [Aphanomyces astaci]